MNSQDPKAARLVPKLMYGFVILSIALAALMFFDQWYSRQQISTLQSENQKQFRQIENIEQEGEIGDLYAAKQILDKASQKKIAWSTVAEKLLAQEGDGESVEFTAINVAADGDVGINGEANDLRSIASLIQKVRLDPTFQGPFVPSINGKSGTFKFQLQFKYLDL